MKKNRCLLRGAWALLVLLSVVALVPSAAAAWRLTTRNGFLTVIDTHTGLPIPHPAIRADGLSDRDRLLLECGISLPDQVAFTRAMEDFFS